MTVNEHFTLQKMLCIYWRKSWRRQLDGCSAGCALLLQLEGQQRSLGFDFLIKTLQTHLKPRTSCRLCRRHRTFVQRAAWRCIHTNKTCGSMREQTHWQTASTSFFCYAEGRCGSPLQSYRSPFWHYCLKKTLSVWLRRGEDFSCSILERV